MTFLSNKSKIHATKNGTTKKATTISNTLSHGESTCINLNALIGPTIPINPKPADSFVPPIPIIPEAIPDKAAVIKIGTIITGYFTIFGIIIFTPPKKIESGIPKRLTWLVPIRSTASVAAIPIDAEPAAIPDKPIAIAIATVDNGEMIIKLKTIEISILISTGCNSVKLFSIFPIPVVINLTYGNVNTPIVADNPPIIVGKTISAILPTRSSTSKINNTAIAAVIIVLMRSPIPAMTHAPF